MTNRESRSPALDGVRGIAILLVLFWHLYACVPHPQWMKYSGPFDWLANIGWSGVDLFFVLSGFLIARILVLHRKQERYFSTFYIRRTARIFPLYYLCIVSFLLVRHWLPPTVYAPLGPLLNNHLVPFWTFPIFVQNVAMASVNYPGGAWLGVTWSLAVEEQFYLILPLLISLVPPASLRRIALMLVVLAPTLGFAILLANDSSGLAVIMLLPTRIDGFALGILAALAVQNHAVVQRAKVRLMSLLSISLFLAIQTLLPLTSGLSQTALTAFNHTSYALMFACLILWVVVVPDGRIARILSFRPLVWLGGTSYFIYLFHQPVHYLVHWAVGGISPTLMTAPGAATTMLALAILFGSAELSRRFFEQPLIGLGHRFTYGARSDSGVH